MFIMISSNCLSIDNCVGDDGIVGSKVACHWYDEQMHPRTEYVIAWTLGVALVHFWG